MKFQKILVVDDEQMLLALEVAYCKRLFPKAEISEAKNGEIAFNQIRLEKPDLVISDVNMPVMDGITLLKLVRGEFPGTKFILLSGKMTDNLKFIASELGAGAALGRPFTFSEFENAIRNL